MSGSTDGARQLLREAGLRSTSCRLAVLQHLSKASRPLTHGEVAEDLARGGFDKTTIYRALVEMAEARLLARLDAGDHVWRFELRQEPSNDDLAGHPHFMCVDCGRVTCLPDVEIQIPSAAKRKLLTVDAVTEILLKGHCVDCR